MISVKSFCLFVCLLVNTEHGPNAGTTTTIAMSTTADEPSSCILMIFYTATLPGQKWCCWVAASSVTRCSWLRFHIVYSFLCTTKEEEKNRNAFSPCFQLKFPRACNTLGVSQQSKWQQPHQSSYRQAFSSRWVSQAFCRGRELQGVRVCRSLRERATRVKWKTFCYFPNKHTRTASNAQRRTSFSHSHVDGDTLAVRLPRTIANWGEFDRAASFIVPWPDKQTDRQAEVVTHVASICDHLKWHWGL